METDKLNNLAGESLKRTEGAGKQMYKLCELEEWDIKTVNSWRNDPELVFGLSAPFRFF